MQEENKKILIVDDSMFARISVKKLLTGRNYELFEAENGEVALNKIESLNPDLIISDNLMPVMNGLELITEMKEKNIDIPVIVISANQQEKTINRFYELGVIGVIKKSPSKSDFFNLVDKAFQRISGV